MRHRGQRHRRAVRRLEIDAVEVVRPGLVFRHAFQDHLVVVGRSIDGRDLARAEGIVQFLTHLIDRHAIDRRLLAVDLDGDLRILDIEIGGDIEQAGDIRHLVAHLGRQPIQRVSVVRLHRVLVLAFRRPAAEIDVLNRLEEYLDAGHVRGGTAQPRDDRLDVVALGAGFKRDQHAAAVDQRIGTAGANGRIDVIDGGIGLDDIGDLALVLDHRRIGDVGLGVGDAVEIAGILGREKALRDDDIKPDRAGHGQQRDAEHDRLVGEHAFERGFIGPQHGVEAALEYPQNDILLLFLAGMMAFQDACAQHRRQRQRNESGNDNGDRDGDREFAEDAADHAAHQQHRDEHGNQREGDRHDGEADFARAFQRRLERPHAAFDVADDVLQHDDGVIDDEADRQSQRQQRHVVDGEAEQIHRRAGADQRHRHGERRNDGGRYFAQKQEDHHDDQRDGDRQGFLHVDDRRADRQRAVEQRRHFNRRRDLRARRDQGVTHQIDDLDGVGVGLALDRQHDGARVVEPGGDFFVLDAVDDAGHFVELDRRAIAVGHDHVAVGGGTLHRTGGNQRHCLLLAFEIADRRCRIGLGHHGADVVERNVARRGGGRIDLHTHGEFLRAIDGHLRDAAQLRQLRRDHGLGVIVDRRQRHGIGPHAEEQHREVARIDLAEERRRGHLDRQAALRHRERGLHIERGAIDIAAEVELNGDRGVAERGRRRHRRNAGDGRQLPLDRRGDRRGPGLGACARQRGDDADGREVNGGQRRHRQKAIGKDAEDDQRRHHQGGEDGPAYTEFRDVHVLRPIL